MLKYLPWSLLWKDNTVKHVVQIRNIDSMENPYITGVEARIFGNSYFSCYNKFAFVICTVRSLNKYLAMLQCAGFIQASHHCPSLWDEYP